MEHEKQDRRIRRTRQILRNALLSLLKEKRYAAISVQDIIERADIARSTFYAHYMDKDDLLSGRWGVFAENLEQHAVLKIHENLEDLSIIPTRYWFHHIQAQGHILKIIARDSAMELAMKTLRDILRRDVQFRLQSHLKDDESNLVPSSLVIDYLTDTLMSLIKWWVSNNMDLSPEQMDRIFQQLTMSGISSAIVPNATTQG